MDRQPAFRRGAQGRKSRTAESGTKLTAAGIKDSQDTASRLCSDKQLIKVFWQVKKLPSSRVDEAQDKTQDGLHLRISK